MTQFIQRLKQWAWLLPVLLFASCMKDRSDEFIPYRDSTVNDTTWYSVLNNNAAVFKIDTLFSTSLTSVDSVDAVTGGTVQFSDGSSVYCPPGFCTAGAGKVKIELLLLRKKGDYVRYAKPTSSYDKILEAGGTFRIRITQNGQPLQLQQGMYLGLQFPSPIINAGMHVYYGDSTGGLPGNFTWETSSFDDELKAYQAYDSANNTMVNLYRMLVHKTGWGSCAYTTTGYGSGTRFSVILPPNYTNANTAVYAVFKADNTVVRLTGDVSSRSFYANIAAGTELTLVAVSKRGNNLYWDSAAVTVNSTGTPAYLHPTQQTIAQIDILLNNL